MSNNEEVGLKNLRHFTSEIGLDAVDKLRENSPELAKYITEFAFGTIYELPTLSDREKICITISSLVSQGEVEALQVHFHSAKNIGLTNEEIKGILLHCIPYTGFPKVLKAMQLFDNMFPNK
ncbi:MAG TPA: carboxymuconolactone decarboxylase family protein [Bacillus bacterium]|nr:carboxymuconolactone decarboxylase family protein [Bacillus sp. (in: firmicutes)]